MNYNRFSKNNFAQKLCLGTAQFGLDYGIANKKGRVARTEVYEILEYAYNRGINNLDTAFSYGESERVIGEFTEGSNLDFKVISKLPSIKDPGIKNVEGIFYESLARLKVKSFYGYLIHEFDDFLKYDALWGILESLKKRGFIEKIGFSFYSPQELKVVLERGINFEIIQIPYSIFDRRFEKYFNLLKENNITIHTRSVFLQGLVFLEPDNLPENLSGAKERVYNIRDLAKKNGIPINALCLNFALLNPDIDKVIIGIDSLEHLKKNLKGINLIQKVRNIYDKLDSLNIEDGKILLPYNKFICQSEGMI